MGRTFRVYVDGAFAGLNVGHLHHLRQAKLSFPYTRLIVGVFSDALCLEHGISLPASSSSSQVDTLPTRLETLRHTRWVDEILPSAPWSPTPQFMKEHRIDYVAVQEGASVEPG
ncbi:hypothetical protein BDV98DRAFT_490534, partial [Pterulicium gracile]